MKRGLFNSILRYKGFPYKKNVCFKKSWHKSISYKNMVYTIGNTFWLKILRCKQFIFQDVSDKLADDNLLMGRTCLRWFMVLSLVYYMSLLGFFSLSSVIEERTVVELDEGNIENGMGGVGYFENNIPGINIEPASLELESVIIGIPEPEEFSKPRLLLYTSYKIRRGDTIGDVARHFGLNQDTIISVNGISNARLVQIDQILRLPNQDGILYSVRSGDTLKSIAAKFKVDAKALQTVNELFSDTVNVNMDLFIPGAKLDWINLQEINGDLFQWPIRGILTSNYGYRADPFTGRGRSFHNGLDIGASMGTPIKAAMSGRVTTAGYDNSYGNYIVISHHSGYRTLYGHLSVIRTKVGAYVAAGEHIGDVGSTGVSTGPHLHFTVYKNGVTVNPRALIK